MRFPPEFAIEMIVQRWRRSPKTSVIKLWYAGLNRSSEVRPGLSAVYARALIDW